MSKNLIPGTGALKLRSDRTLDADTKIRVTGYATPGAGEGLEIGYTGLFATIGANDRPFTVWKALYVDGLTLHLNVFSGGAITLGGDTIWSGEGHGIPYGHMYQNATGFSVTLTTLNTWYELDAATTNISAGQLNLVTFPDDHYLQVTNAGRYKIDWSCTAQINATNQGVECGIMVNGAIQSPGQARMMFLNTGRNLCFGSTAILDLAANDQISLGARNISTGSDILTVSFLNMTAIMVGGT